MKLTNNTSHMDLIIHIVYDIVNKYTNIKDLCDTCKYIHIYKKYIIYIKLNRKKSFEYYNNTNFRSLVLSKIIDPFEQLSINLSKYNTIMNVNHLNNLHSLDLSDCKYIKDFSTLTKIYILNLTYCNISDVNHLGTCDTLILDRCINIIDVSALGGVKNLSLSHCHNITNVSALGNVYNLCLCNCHNLRDIKSLQNNHILIIKRCHNISDFTNLKNINTLDISYCNISDISIFKNVKKLIADHIYS